MVRIFFLPYLGNCSKSDPCSYELFCLELHILSFPKVLQIPSESPCMCVTKNVNVFEMWSPKIVWAMAFSVFGVHHITNVPTALL